jgi:hypothetical protein
MGSLGVLVGFSGCCGRLLARSSREAPGWRQRRGISCEDGGGRGPRPCGSLPHWSSLGFLSLSRLFWTSGFTLASLDVRSFTVSFIRSVLSYAGELHLQIVKFVAVHKRRGFHNFNFTVYRGLRYDSRFS